MTDLPWVLKPNNGFGEAAAKLPRPKFHGRIFATIFASCNSYRKIANYDTAH